MKQEYKPLYEKFGLNVVYYRKRKRLTQMKLAELVDIAAELDRIAKERAKAEDNLRRIEAKLATESFTSRAPEAVVNAEREKADKARALIAKLDESAAAMQF